MITTQSCEDVRCAHLKVRGNIVDINCVQPIRFMSYDPYHVLLIVQGRSRPTLSATFLNELSFQLNGKIP